MYVYVFIFVGFILPLLGHYGCSLIKAKWCLELSLYSKAAKQEETYGTSVVAAQF